MELVQDLRMCRMSALDRPLFGRRQDAVAVDTGQCPGACMPLAFLSAGTSGRISLLRGPSEMVRHITELGFVEGAEVRVVSGNLGNLIIELKGSRLAIGRQMASHIIVTR